jgi:cell division septum initiation protein DivIVA
MKLTVDVNINVRGQNESEVLELLNKIIKQNNKMAATIEQFESALNRIDTATTNIAQQLRDLKDQIANQGLPAELETQVLTRLETSATQLEAVGTSVENPVPNP